MNKASELRGQLNKAGMAGTDVERIVKGEIDNGNIIDDGLAGSIPMQLLIDAAQGLRDVESGEGPATTNAIAKGGPALGEDLSDLLRATCANSEATVEFQNDVFPQIAKGILAHGSVIESLVGAVASLEEIVKGFAAKLNQPVAPRGVTPGAAPLVHPNDVVVKGGAQSAAPARTAPLNVTRDALYKGLREKQLEEIEKGGDPAIVTHLGKAIGAIENTQMTVSQIIKTFDIGLA